jgi:hypothetical protein
MLTGACGYIINRGEQTNCNRINTFNMLKTYYKRNAGKFFYISVLVGRPINKLNVQSKGISEGYSHYVLPCW